ncbi:MAG TPA: tetratricopeptide repeat protein, partial [Flavobacteriales bacterium]|nr:tetratricopeptide repeat protein [Flavobacteriales bacterium]
PAQKTDSVLAVYNKKSNHDTVRLQAITNLARSFLLKSPDSAELFARKGLPFAKKTKQKKWEARLYNTIGLSCFYRGNYIKALENYFSGLKLREALKDKPGIAAQLNNIGGVYSFMFDYEKALNYYKKALAIAEPLNDTYVMGNAYGNIANIYFDLPDSLCKRLGLSVTQKFLESIKYNQKSLKIAEATNYKESIAITYGNLGAIYARIPDSVCHLYGVVPGRQYEKALEYHNKSLKLKLEIDDRQGLPVAYHNISALYYRLKQYNKAIESGLKALTLVREIGDIDTEKDIHRALYKIYKDMGQAAKAFEHYEQYATLRDSIYKIDNQKEIVKKELQYEYEKKQAAMVADSLKRVNEKQSQETVHAAELKHERTLLYTFAGGAFLLIALIVLFLNQRRLVLKKKSLEEKETLLSKINDQQKELLNATLNGQELERKRIATELHDGLGSLLSTVKLNLDTTGHKLKDPEKKELDKAIVLLDNVCEDLRTISHNMMPGALTKLGIASAVRDFILKVNASGHLKIHFEAHGLEERMPENAEIALFRVIQEATNNILKHTEATKASIQLIRHDETLTLMIEDNGRGFDMNKIKFGMGLKNIESRMIFLGGKVVFDSHPGKGTSIVIELPYKTEPENGKQKN